MTTLTFDELTIRAGHLGGESSLPSILPVLNVQTEKSARLDEDDEIFFDIGKIRSIFPYNQQDLYDRALDPQSFRTAVLENDFLRAVFLPELGGRLWSLFDKKAGRELLYVNDVVRYCNLALRNAWISGGVEWNIGMIGHSPFTCAPLFTARLEAGDGTPILRMYEYERLRGITYQMDFSLPEGSPLLLCRMRVTNLQNKTIPMYWWSNIAVPETPDRRIVVPTDESYYSFWSTVAKTPIPMRAGKDVTYPVNTECSMDYFYRIPEENRKYIACLDKDGYGLVQTSTRRLKGRKLFVWGQSEGGHTWQRFLTDKAGDYSEIQAGLARTQYECIPMPPCSAWEWVEGYGAMSADPAKVHGGWPEARREVEQRLEERMPADALEGILIRSRADYVFKKGDLIQNGSGFGALENRRRQQTGERLLPEHLDFGEPGDAQRHWMEPLETGRLPEPRPDEVPPSYLVDDAWFDLVRRSREQDGRNWYAAYMEGLFHMSRGAYPEAEACFEASRALQPACWNLYALAICRYAQRDTEGGVPYLLEAMDRRPEDVSLARDVFRFLQECGQYDRIVERYTAFSTQLQQDGKLKFYLACAYAHLGELDKAEELLYENGCLVVPIIREGEMSLTSLWFYIEEQKYKNRGEPFDENAVQPPAFLDFRMGVADV